MVRSNPNTAGRFYHYQQLRAQDREELANARNPNYESRLQRYATRPILSERGMLIDEMPNPRVREIAEEQGWLRYTQQPEAFDPDIVREFYAALIPPSFDSFHTVVVRDRIVHMSPEDIRVHYGAPHHPHLEATHGISLIPGVGNADHYSPRIASTLRRSGREHWVVRSDEIKKSELYPEIGVWLRFVKANLAVSTHYTNADSYVARILYCLQTNLPIDIGMIIKQHILFAAAERATGILPFPCLITRFCRDAGIEVNLTGIPSAPFDRVTYRAQTSAAQALDGQDALSLERMRIPDNADDNEAEDDDYEPELDVPRPRAPRRRNAPRPTDFESLANYIDQQNRELRQEFGSLQREVRDGFRDLRNLYIGNANPTEAGPSQPRPARRVRGRNTGGASSSRHQSSDD